MTISFSHNVFRILGQTSTKFHGQGSCDTEDITVASLAGPAVSTVMHSHFAIVFSDQPKLKLNCPFSSMYSMQSTTTSQNAVPITTAMALFFVIHFSAICHHARSGCTGVSPCSPLIHYLNGQILKKTLENCHNTYPCKLAYLSVPWWPRYWGRNIHFPTVQTAMPPCVCNHVSGSTNTSILLKAMNINYPITNLNSSHQMVSFLLK